MIRSGLTYTLTGAGAAGSVTLNPTNYSGDGFYIVERPDVMLEPQTASMARPSAHGSIMAPTYLAGVQLGFTIAGVYEASASARQTAEDTLFKVVGSMLDADGSLSFSPHDGGSTRVIRNLRAASTPTISDNAGPYLIYSVELFSERHVAESDTETDTDSSALTSTGGGLTFPMTFPILFTGSGAGTLTCPNGGNSESYPVLTITGPITNPSITKAGTGERIKLATTIASGETIEVDLYRRTVKAGGTSSVQSTLDVANTSWFSIPAGGVQLQLSGTSFDSNTKLTASSRDAWRL